MAKQGQCLALATLTAILSRGCSKDSHTDSQQHHLEKVQAARGGQVQVQVQVQVTLTERKGPLSLSWHQAQAKAKAKAKAKAQAKANIKSKIKAKAKIKAKSACGGVGSTVAPDNAAESFKEFSMIGTVYGCL